MKEGLLDIQVAICFAVNNLCNTLMRQRGYDTDLFFQNTPNLTFISETQAQI